MLLILKNFFKIYFDSKIVHLPLELLFIMFNKHEMGYKTKNTNAINL